MLNQRQQQKVILRHRSGWLSPQRTSRCRWRRFPLRRCTPLSPDDGTRLPLSPHCNPFAALADSLGDFHPGVTPFLILFCRKNFKERSYFALGRSLVRCFSYPNFPTQGRLRCTQRSRHKGRVAPQCRFISRPVHEVDTTKPGVRSVHSNRVSTETGSVPPCHWRVARSPQAQAFAFASLQHPPQTGRKKQAPEASQLCPLKDF